VLDESKDLIALQRRLAARTQEAVSSAVRTAVRSAMREAVSAAPPSVPAVPAAAVAPRAAVRPPAPGAASDVVGKPALAEQVGLTAWPAGLPDDAIPLTVETDGPGGVRVRGYPAIVDESPGVALRVLADPAVQVEAHRRGLRRLLLLDAGLATARVTTRWSGTQALTLASGPYRTTDALVTDVQLAAIDRIVAEHLAGRPATEVRSATTYAALRAVVRARLEDAVHAVVTDVVAVLTAARELDVAVRASNSLALLATTHDVRDHAARLVHDGFVSATGADRLPHLARYLRADRHRLTKAADNPHRDAERAWQVHQLEEAYRAARDRVSSAPPDRSREVALDDVRWMLEELRVSLFAQQLGTPAPVSDKRIRKALSEV